MTFQGEERKIRENDTARKKACWGTKLGVRVGVLVARGCDEIVEVVAGKVTTEGSPEQGSRAQGSHHCCLGPEGSPRDALQDRGAGRGHAVLACLSRHYQQNRDFLTNWVQKSLKINKLSSYISYSFLLDCPSHVSVSHHHNSAFNKPPQTAACWTMMHRRLGPRSVLGRSDARLLVARAVFQDTRSSEAGKARHAGPRLCSQL